MKRSVGAIIWLATAMLVGHAGSTAAQCCGDCNGDNQVTVDEIVTGISRALSGCSNDGVCNASVESCNTHLFNLQLTLDATREELASARQNLSACNADLAACLSAPRVPASGQTTSHGPGSDGELRPGPELSYTDNGDGTITDNNTRLMWEKKDDSDGIHDKDNNYTWSTSGTIMDGTLSTTFLAALNAGDGFAGHTDWRIPSVKEMQTIVDYEPASPTVDAAFHQAGSCTGCMEVTAPTCSCSASDGYWSSTTYRYNPNAAWVVGFGDGSVGGSSKDMGYRVRAVRGGL